MSERLPPLLAEVVCARLDLIFLESSSCRLRHWPVLLRQARPPARRSGPISHSARSSCGPPTFRQGRPLALKTSVTPHHEPSESKPRTSTPSVLAAARLRGPEAREPGILTPEGGRDRKGEDRTAPGNSDQSAFASSGKLGSYREDVDDDDPIEGRSPHEADGREAPLCRKGRGGSPRAEGCVRLHQPVRARGRHHEVPAREPEHVRKETFAGKPVLVVEPEALTLLAREAMRDVSFLLRPKHQRQVAAILEDPEASPNDRFMATALLRERRRRREVRAAVLPGHRHGDGRRRGRASRSGRARTTRRFSRRESGRPTPGRTSATPRPRALTMYDEINTGDNLPAQIDIYATPGRDYRFLFVAKGGGSANKTYLFQETKALLNPASLERFLVEKMKTLGTAACPPYHVAFVVGGTSAEACLKTVKLASTGYYDSLPTTGDRKGRAFRDRELEAQAPRGRAEARLRSAVRRQVLRPRRPGDPSSAPRRLVSGRTRRVLFGGPQRPGEDRRGRGSGSRSSSGIRRSSFPSRAPQASRDGHEAIVRIDLNRPMPEILAELSKHPVATAARLTGRLIVARDIAHAKLKERLDSGGGPAAVLQGPPGLLRGTGQEAARENRPARSGRRPRAGWTPTWISSSRNGGSHDHDREGQPERRGDGGVQQARRLLSRVARRPGRAARGGEHPEGRGPRVSRAREWRRSGRSTSSISPPSSWWTTRETTSSSS